MEHLSGGDILGYVESLVGICVVALLLLVAMHAGGLRTLPLAGVATRRAIPAVAAIGLGLGSWIATCLLLVGLSGWVASALYAFLGPLFPTGWLFAVLLVLIWHRSLGRLTGQIAPADWQASIRRFLLFVAAVVLGLVTWLSTVLALAAVADHGGGGIDGLILLLSPLSLVGGLFAILLTLVFYQVLRRYSGMDDRG